MTDDRLILVRNIIAVNISRGFAAAGGKFKPGFGTDWAANAADELARTGLLVDDEPERRPDAHLGAREDC